MSQDTTNHSKGPSNDDHATAGPFQGVISGETITQWTQDWFTWALQAQPSSSPFLAGSRGDESGGFENGKMFFLGGFDTSQGPPLDVHVRHGEPILVPLLNFVDTQDPKATENGYVSQFKQADTTLFATLDGKSIEHLHQGLITTDFFSAGAAQPKSYAVADIGAAVGSNLAPTEGVGYWIVIQGLSKGAHTLDFGGQTSFLGGFSTHTTDTIHVT